MGSELQQQRCQSCEGIGAPLNREQIENLMPQVDKKWEVNADNTAISRTFAFKDFYETMAFVNAVAWIANKENHHPDLSLGYNYCVVNFMTHALKGLSLNDFICAAKLDRLLYV